jgi:hypothetical protein
VSFGNSFATAGAAVEAAWPVSGATPMRASPPKNFATCAARSNRARVWASASAGRVGNSTSSFQASSPPSTM